MAENIHGFDNLGTLVKTQERKSLIAEIREHAYRTGDASLAVPVIHLMLTNPRGELYIVQRADKSENPLLWDKTVGGHVTAGESYSQALRRESLEELKVPVIIADMLDYRDVVASTDLSKFAVVRMVDFDPWSASLRAVKNGNPWIKRDRRVLYAGMYDGTVEYKDGEAKDKALLQPADLQARMAAEPNIFTDDLRKIMSQYGTFFRPV